MSPGGPVTPLRPTPPGTPLWPLGPGYPLGPAGPLSPVKVKQHLECIPVDCNTLSTHGSNLAL